MNFKSVRLAVLLNLVLSLVLLPLLTRADDVVAKQSAAGEIFNWVVHTNKKKGSK